MSDFENGVRCGIAASAGFGLIKLGHGLQELEIVFVPWDTLTWQTRLDSGTLCTIPLRVYQDLWGHEYRFGYSRNANLLVIAVEED